MGALSSGTGTFILTPKHINIVQISGMATPLKVSSLSKAEQSKETSGPTSGPSGTDAVMGTVEDISSAHELTAFVNISRLTHRNHFTECLPRCQVENLLTQIEAKFDDMSTQVLDRSKPRTVHLPDTLSDPIC